MNRKIILIGIGIVVISIASIGAISSQITSISFGRSGDTEAKYTLYGFYNGKTVYSGDGYYLKLDNDTFYAWYDVSNGYRYHINGTYRIKGSEITGAWLYDYNNYGWISGHLGG